MPVRVYYEDTDAGGIVYYANYLKFMERVRTEWLRTLGYEQDVLIAQERVVFAVRSAQMDYLKPAVFNDLLQVTAEIIERNKASLVFSQNIYRENSEGVLEHLVRGKIKIVSVNMDSFKPIGIPKLIMEAIERDH
jgi:acyl-CoA thioester hydrolase